MPPLMRKIVPLITCVLLLCAARAEAACERELTALRTTYYGPSAQMDVMDAEIKGWLENDSEWRNTPWSKVQMSPSKPADPAAAYRKMAEFWTVWESPGISKAVFLFRACRARVLADQLDAPRLAREQAARDAAAQQQRDQLMRDQAARDTATRTQTARDAAARRQAELTAAARETIRLRAEEAERIRLLQEEEARGVRETAARLEAERLAAAEAERIAEERADARERAANARRKAEEDKRRKEEEEARKPFIARNVSECVSLLAEDDGTYGGFLNRCDFPIYVAYCAIGPREKSWATAFDCDQNKGGLDHIEANGWQSAHTRNVQRMVWFACNAPSTPAVEYRAGMGFWGSCR